MSLSNLLAQDTQTATVICTAKKWDASEVKEEKIFRELLLHFGKKNRNFCVINSWIAQQIILQSKCT